MTRGGRPRSAYAAWIAVCLIWGTTYLAIRVALDTIPPGLLGGLRWTLAGLLLAAGLAARGRRLPPPGRWGPYALLGCLLIVVGNGGVIWAEQWVPSGLTAVIIASTPFWMVGIEALRPRGERATRRGLAGLLAGFAGILLLVGPDLRTGEATGAGFAWGVAAIQLACLGWALGSAYSRHVAAAGDSTLGGATVQMLAGGLVMLALGTAAGEWSRVSLDLRSGAALAYLTIAGSVAAYVAYLHALHHLPVSTVSLYAYINPVIAVVLGTLVLGEPFNVRMAIGTAIVLAAVAVVRSGGAVDEPRPAATGAPDRPAALRPCPDVEP